MTASSKSRTDELLRLLGTSVLPVEDAEVSVARRARVVPNLITFAADSQAKHARFARARTVLSLAAAVAIFGTGAAYGVRHYAAPKTRGVSNAVLAVAGLVEVIHDRGEETLLPLETRVGVERSDEIVTAPGAEAKATLASGAEVRIGPDSRVRLLGGQGVADGTAEIAAGEAVDLAAGRVVVHVPKLGPARSFSVRTSDATVTVHGTIFTVERAAGGASPSTSVDVEQGSVSVVHDGVEVWLQRGDHWSSAPAPLPAAGDTHAEGPAPSDRVQGIPPGAAGTHEKGASSSLAAENRIVQSIMTARQGGGAGHALKLADRFLARYPTSPLVEVVRVERLRALAALGPAQVTAAEARRYQADYPQGFARQEAARLAGDSSTR